MGRNYSSAAQITTGLRHHSVSRLKNLKESLSQKTENKLEKLVELFSPASNYSVYRNLSTESPCLRFLAVYQRDIRFICDGNSLFLGKNENIYNMERIIMIAECYNKLGMAYPKKSYKYDIKPDIEFQERLSQLKTISEDDLFTLSFISEPSRNGEHSPLQNSKPYRVASNPLHKSQKLEKLYKSNRGTKNLRPNTRGNYRKRSASDLDILSVDFDEYNKRKS